MKLYLVLSFDKEINKWNVENTFANRSDALEEKECLRAHLKAKEIKIMPLNNPTNAEILNIVKELNGE